MVSKIAILIGALALFAPAQGRKGGGGQPVQPAQQVKPGLYMIAGAGANSEVREYGSKAGKNAGHAHQSKL